jgi:hypothetical protein
METSALLVVVLEIVLKFGCVASRLQPFAKRFPFYRDRIGESCVDGCG